MSDLGARSPVQQQRSRSQARAARHDGGRLFAMMAAAFFVVVMALVLSIKPAAAGAFDSLKGGWSGGGRASFANGQTEKLRCSARYGGGGTNLTINVRCASSSANIALSGSLAANGNKVSGSWSESSYGLNGSASGSTTGQGVRLRISGSLSGTLSLTASGSRHTLALATGGSTLTGVNVSMGRR
jgi:hypothetical protein